jgi:hypothetical protein
MNIAWLFAENTVLPPTTPVQAIRDLAPIWGSWRTQRSYQSDNVVCWDPTQAEKLVRQGHAKTCNLYIPETVYQQLSKPVGVRAFGGGFDFGAGPGKPITRKVRGGPLGVIFDARGRPLALPTDLSERRACLNKWIKALRVYG